MSDKRRVETSTTSAAFRAESAAEESNRDPDAATMDNGDPAELGEQIVRTRANMAETIEAIQEKLDPRTLKQQARDAARAATVGRVESAVSAADEKAQQLARTLSERTTTIKESASQQAGRVVSKVRAGREAGAAGEQGTAGSWNEKAIQARMATRRGVEELQTQIRRRPLAGCLVALALGALLGRATRPSANGYEQEPDVLVVPTASPAITAAEAYPEI